MPEPLVVPWPPAPLTTDRLVLRPSAAQDREAFVHLLSCDEVHTFLGGPQDRHAVESSLPDVPEAWPGSLVVEHDGAMVGHILLRRATEHRSDAARGRVDLGYLFLPRVWGRGLATEACGAALAWVADVLPGEDVVLTTQSANTASMRLAAGLGFVEVDRFVAWGAEQWVGRRRAG